ncbi:hypothetical protein ACJ5XU_004222 [Providencia stuartii]
MYRGRWTGFAAVRSIPHRIITLCFGALDTVAYNAGIQWLYQPGAITPTARYQKGQLHSMVTDHQGTPREIFTEKGIASWVGCLNTWGQMAFWQSHDGQADNDPHYTKCHFRFARQYKDRETWLVL